MDTVFDGAKIFGADPKAAAEVTKMGILRPNFCRLVDPTPICGPILIQQGRGL